jgi:hypothetical protein
VWAPLVKLEYVAKVAARATWESWTGQNTVDGLIVNINLGVVQGNASLLQQLYTILWDTVLVEPDGSDGTQVDGMARD